MKVDLYFLSFEIWYLDLRGTLYGVYPLKDRDSDSAEAKLRLIYICADPSRVSAGRAIEIEVGEHHKMIGGFDGRGGRSSPDSPVMWTECFLLNSHHEVSRT